MLFFQKINLMSDCVNKVDKHLVEAGGFASQSNFCWLLGKGQTCATFMMVCHSHSPYMKNMLVLFYLPVPIKEAETQQV